MEDFGNGILVLWQLRVLPFCGTWSSSSSTSHEKMGNGICGHHVIGHVWQTRMQVLIILNTLCIMICIRKKYHVKRGLIIPPLSTQRRHRHTEERERRRDFAWRSRTNQVWYNSAPIQVRRRIWPCFKGQCRIDLHFSSRSFCIDLKYKMKNPTVVYLIFTKL